MNNRTSNFTTIGGIVFLLVFILYTNAMGYRKISGFLIFFLIIALCSFVWGKFSLNKLSLSLAREDLSAFPGETIPVRLSLANQKFLPITWLDILFPLPSPPCVWPGNEEETGVHDDPKLARQVQVFPRKLSWILPFQEIEWSFQLNACMRGIYHIDSVYLESGDGFGLSVTSRRIALDYPKQVTVYPRRIPVDVSALLHQDTSEAQGSHGYQEDITLLKHSRAYQYGDNFRRINWRLLARQQELMVNEYETVSPQCMGFYIDLESFVSFRIEQTSGGSELKIPILASEELEHMLSLTGSCICELTARRIPCAVFIPGYGDQEVRICFGSDLDYQVPQLLSELSAITYEKEHWETRISPSDLRPHRSRIGQLYIVSFSTTRLCTNTVSECLSSHLLSYLVYEHSPGDLRMERPVSAFSELTFSLGEEHQS